jgi:hypothetical protein
MDYRCLDCGGSIAPGLRCPGCADEKRTASAQKLAAQRCIEIAERHAQEWIKPSSGAAPVPIGSHACYLVIEEIRREFGLKAD